MPASPHGLDTLERTNGASPANTGHALGLLVVARSMLVDSATREVIAAFSERGVMGILLKGPTFASWLYGDKDLRPYRDCDLLVSPRDLPRAEETLVELGFSNAKEAFAHPRMEAQEWVRTGVDYGLRVDVDLHETLWGVGADRHRTWTVLSQKTEVQEVAGIQVETLNAAGRLLHVALHAAKNGASHPQSMEDLRRALRLMPYEAWVEATRLAKHLSATPAFATGLRLTREGEALATRLGLSAAQSVEATLKIAPVPLAQGLEQLRLTPGLRARRELLASELFPTRAFMRWWSPLARRGKRGLVAAYGYRLLWFGLHLPPALVAWRRAYRDAHSMTQPNGEAQDSDVLEKEQEFHDALATSLTGDPPPPRVPDHLERALLDRLGDLSGTTVLDLGCGSGDLTLHLLERGAAVTALDLSPGMVDVARRRAAAFQPGRPLELVVAPAESTGVESQSFDRVVGKWILHHVDVDATAREIARVLKPGGEAVFIENSALNRVLAWSRKRVVGRFGVPRYGTEDEHPLTAADYDRLARLFGGFELTFPDFCFFQLFDRQILRFRSGRTTRTVRRLDDLVWRYAPPLRRYSFHVILEMTK